MTALRGLSTRLGVAARGAQVDHLRQRRASPRCCRRRCAARTRRMPENPIRRAAGGAAAEQPARGDGRVLRAVGPVHRGCATSYRGQPQQRRDLFARSARARGVRVRHRRRCGGHAQLATDRRTLQMTQDTLRSLSEETDGRAIVNRNDLLRGARADRARLELLLPARLQLDAAPTDGKFHEIKVRVKRRGVEVARAQGLLGGHGRRHADGRPTPAMEVAEAGASRRWRRSSAIGPGERVRAHVGRHASAATGGKTRVTLIWEPLAASPPGARRDPPGACRRDRRRRRRAIWCSAAGPRCAGCAGHGIAGQRHGAARRGAAAADVRRAARQARAAADGRGRRRRRHARPRDPDHRRCPI